MGSYIKAMMKAMPILMILNFLVVVGAVGFLWGTERLDKNRVEELVDLFRMTIEEEKNTGRVRCG